jgi:hypothetical protein
MALLAATLIDQKNDRSGGDTTPQTELENVQGVPPHRAVDPPFSPTKTREANPYSDRKEWREEQNFENQRGATYWAEWSTKGTWVGSAAAVAAALATFLGIYLIYGTLLATRGMLQEAADVTKASLAMVVEAEKATKAAERSADIQLDSFRRLERPYLFLVIDDVHRLKSAVGHQSITYRVSNTGKLPAIIRSTSINLTDDEGSVEHTTGAMSNHQYEIIGAGCVTNSATLSISRPDGTKHLEDYGGQAATRLVLVAHFEYEDPTGAIHNDWIRMRANVNAQSFRLDGENAIKRTTTYPTARGSAQDPF